MKYPDWAPIEIIDSREQIEADFVELESIHFRDGSRPPEFRSASVLIDLLLRDERLSRVWKTIGRYSELTSSPKLSGELCRIILRTLLYTDSYPDSIKPSERVRRLDSLQNHLGKVRVGLEEMRVSQLVLPLYYKQVNRYPTLLDVPIPPGTFTSRSALQILDELDRSLEDFKGFQGVLNVSKSELPDRKKGYLIQSLQNFFALKVGKWSDEEVSLLVEVLLDEPISVDAIASKRKNSPPQCYLWDPIRALWK